MRRAVLVLFLIGAIYTVSLFARQQPIANLQATNTADGSKIGLDVNILGTAGDDLSSILGVLEDILSAMAPDATHDSAALSTGPQGMAYGSTSVPTAVTAGDAVRLWATLNGALVTRMTDGTNLASIDPCRSETKTTTAFSQTSIGNIISADANKTNYVCAFVVVASAAEVVSIVEDDTSGCGSLTAALAGSTTAANGMSLAANGGISWGNGDSAILKGSAANRYLCVAQDGSDRISGSITWVQR